MSSTSARTTGGRTTGRRTAATLARTLAVLGAIVLGTAAVAGCTETRPPMLQPTAPVPEVTGTD
jgi:hypothetical protein